MRYSPARRRKCQPPSRRPMPLVLARCVSPILNCMSFSGNNRISDLLFQAGLRKVLLPGFPGLEEGIAGCGQTDGAGPTPPQPANSLLPCRSRRSRARLCLLGPTANHAQEHRAALVDFHRLAVGGQRDFTNRLRASGLEDFKVAESVCPAGVHGEEPKRLRLRMAVNRDTACSPQILIYVGQHAVTGIFPHELRSHEDWPTLSVGNLVASDFNFIVGSLAGAWLR